MIVEQSPKIFEPLEIDFTASFQADVQVHFVKDIEKFREKYGEYWSQELELDKIIKVRESEILPEECSGSTKRLFFAFEESKLDQEGFE